MAKVITNKRGKFIMARRDDEILILKGMTILDAFQFYNTKDISEKRMQEYLESL